MANEKKNVECYECEWAGSADDLQCGYDSAGTYQFCPVCHSDNLSD